MGDLPEDAHVSASPKNSEVTLTVGFLNDKVWICLILTLMIVIIIVLYHHCCCLTLSSSSLSLSLSSLYDNHHHSRTLIEYDINHINHKLLIKILFDSGAIDNYSTGCSCAITVFMYLTTFLQTRHS